MRKGLWVCGCILNFPLDLIRLTIHSWQISGGWIINRLGYKHAEQRCPFCRDCDQSVVPRAMHRQIRYWNIWLIQLLLPHLKSYTNPTLFRRIPICKNDTGYLHNAWQAFLLVMALSAGWLALFIWLYLLTEG
jgi:hypothetical protein